MSMLLLRAVVTGLFLGLPYVAMAQGELSPRECEERVQKGTPITLPTLWIAIIDNDLETVKAFFAQGNVIPEHEVSLAFSKASSTVTWRHDNSILRFLIRQGLDWKTFEANARLPHVPNAVLDVIEEDRATKGEKVFLEEIAAFRDWLIQATTTSRMNAYEAIMIRLRDMKNLPYPMINAEVINKASLVALIDFYESNQADIQFTRPQVFGSMIVQELGIIGKNGFALKELTSEATLASGFRLASLGDMKIWLLEDTPSAHTKLRSSDGTMRSFRRLGIKEGGMAALYVDEKSGVVFSICVDSNATQIMRTEYALEVLRGKVRKALSNGPTDIFPLLKAELALLSSDLRADVALKITDEFATMMATRDRERLIRDQSKNEMLDVSKQIASFKRLVAQYRQTVPEDAEVDFPVDPSAKALGFRINGSRGKRLARQWLKDLISDETFENEDLNAYLNALSSLDAIQSWTSLPLDRALLVLFRQAPFDNIDPALSHRYVLQNFETYYFTDPSAPPRLITLEQAIKNLEDAVKRLKAQRPVTRP